MRYSRYQKLTGSRIDLSGTNHTNFQRIGVLRWKGVDFRVQVLMKKSKALENEGHSGSRLYRSFSKGVSEIHYDVGDLLSYDVH
jgi:hypothetical protein